MNELRALRNRVSQVRFICELSAQDKKTLEHLAKFEASLKGFKYNPDFMNDKAWCAVDLIDRMTELFAEV